MPTTSQILGWTPQEKAAAVFTTAGEAGPGKDALLVLQTILARKASSGGNVASLVKAKNQFVANDPYTLNQVVDPNYGKKVYGSRYNQIEQMLEDSMQMASALETGQAATQFRGQAAIKNKRKGDIMFDPKGNFLLSETKNPNIAQTYSARLRKGAGTQTTQPGTEQQPSSPANTYNIYMSGENQEAKDWLTSTFLPKLLNQSGQSQQVFDPRSLLAEAFNPRSSLGEA